MGNERQATPAAFLQGIQKNAPVFLQLRASLGAAAGTAAKSAGDMAQHAPIVAAIHDFWGKPANRDTRAWSEHRVCIATQPFPLFCRCRGFNQLFVMAAFLSIGPSSKQWGMALLLAETARCFVHTYLPKGTSNAMPDASIGSYTPCDVCTRAQDINEVMWAVSLHPGLYLELAGLPRAEGCLERRAR
jgi:hypothetical protein